MDGKRKREIIQDNKEFLGDSLSVLSQIDDSLVSIQLDNKTPNEWWDQFRIKLPRTLTPTTTVDIIAELQNKLSIAYKKLSNARIHKNSVASLIKDKNTKLRKKIKEKNSALGPQTISQTADLQTSDLLPIERIAEIKYKFWEDIVSYLRDNITIISQLNFSHSNEIKIIH